MAIKPKEDNCEWFVRPCLTTCGPPQGHFRRCYDISLPGTYITRTSTAPSSTTRQLHALGRMAGTPLIMHCQSYCASTCPWPLTAISLHCPVIYQSMHRHPQTREHTALQHHGNLRTASVMLSNDDEPWGACLDEDITANESTADPTLDPHKLEKVSATSPRPISPADASPHSLRSVMKQAFPLEAIELTPAYTS